MASKLIVRECAHSLCAHSAKGGDPTTDNYAVIAFSSKDHGADSGPLSPTLRACPHDKSHSNGGGPPAIAFMPARTLAKDGGVDERFAERPISDALHGSSGNGNKAPIIFHPTQDPIVSVGGPTHSLGCGSANGQASVAVAINEEPKIFQTRVARNGRGAPDSVAPALNGTNAGETSDMRPCVISRMAVRRLTPRECERLMGWPDDWTIGFSDSTRYKMCGNGVVSKCSAWIARRIVKLMETTA